MFGHKPHPARFTRYLTAGASTTAFLTLVGAFSLNAQAAQQAATAADGAAQPATTPTVAPTAASASPTPVAKAKPAKKKATAPKATVSKTTTTKKKTTGSTTTGTKPAPSATPTTTPSVSYTCKSPGGSTKPLRNGSCSYVAQYGYVKVKV